MSSDPWERGRPRRNGLPALAACCLAPALAADGKGPKVAQYPHFARGQTLAVRSPDGQFARRIHGNGAGRTRMRRGVVLTAAAFLEGCGG